MKPGQTAGHCSETSPNPAFTDPFNILIMVIVQLPEVKKWQQQQIKSASRRVVLHSVAFVSKALPTSALWFLNPSSEISLS